MSSRQLRLPIKCNVIGGQLASGKTSLILRLLATKPKNEVWAVLVNEAGAVGIDQALFSGATTSNSNDAAAGSNDSASQVKIKMLGGGCLCCTLSSVTSAALVQLIRSSKPDRLIIEPSGLAHPKALLKMLTGPHLATALDLQPILCLVDLTTFNHMEEFLQAEEDEDSNFIAQVDLADVLIGTKADICSREQQDDFISWALALKPRPAKVLISTTSEMNYTDLSLVIEEAKVAAVDKNKSKKENLKEVESEEISSLFSDGMFLNAEQGDAGKSRMPKETTKKVWLTNAHGSDLSSEEKSLAPEPRNPIRKELATASGGTSTCGWIFSSEDTFSAAELQKFAAAALPHILRLKGIFRVEGDKWVLISIGSGQQKKINDDNGAACVEQKRSGDGGGDGEEGCQVSLQALDGMYQDSRVEIIVESKQEINLNLNLESKLAEALRLKDWSAVQGMLMKLLLPLPS
jgi:G3E family GTPase